MDLLIYLEHKYKLFSLQMGDHFCNSVGIMQQFGPSGTFVGFERTASKPAAVENEGKYMI